jgi:hypothetical protein
MHILIIYRPNAEHTDINTILTQFNQLRPNLHFTIEQGENMMINFLDLTTSRSNNEAYSY